MKQCGLDLLKKSTHYYTLIVKYIWLLPDKGKALAGIYNFIGAAKRFGF